MFLVNRTLRSSRTSALHPFRTRALRPPPISQPWAYCASKRGFHSEFSKAALGTGGATYPRASQVSSGTRKEVSEDDKADVHPQAKIPGDIHKRVAILQAVQQQAIVGGISKLERGVKELKPELKERTGGSKWKMNWEEGVKWWGQPFFWVRFVGVAFIGTVLITCFYLDPKAQREFEVRLEGLISDRHAKFRAEMIEFLDAPIAEKREFRKSTKALGTPSSKD